MRSRIYVPAEAQGSESDEYGASGKYPEAQYLRDVGCLHSRKLKSVLRHIKLGPHLDRAPRSTLLLFVPRFSLFAV